MTRTPPRWIAARIDQVSHLRQRSRRAIAVATLVGIPAAYAWSSFWLHTTVPTLVWGPITFVLFGVTICCALLLGGYVRQRADRPGAHLDERQRQLRDQAWILSYQVLSTAVIVGVVVAGLAVWVFGHPITIDGDLVYVLVILVAGLLPVLPTAALAWIEPDPVDEP